MQSKVNHPKVCNKTSNISTKPRCGRTTVINNRDNRLSIRKVKLALQKSSQPLAVQLVTDIVHAE